MTLFFSTAFVAINCGSCFYFLLSFVLFDVWLFEIMMCNFKIKYVIFENDSKIYKYYNLINYMILKIITNGIKNIVNNLIGLFLIMLCSFPFHASMINK